MPIDSHQLNEFSNREWDDSAIPELIEYIRIPNKSPVFDPDWQANGFMDRVVDQFSAWSGKQNIAGMQLEVVRLPDSEEE